MFCPSGRAEIEQHIRLYYVSEWQGCVEDDQTIRTVSFLSETDAQRGPSQYVAFWNGSVSALGFIRRTANFLQCLNVEDAKILVSGKIGYLPATIAMF